MTKQNDIEKYVAQEFAKEGYDLRRKIYKGYLFLLKLYKKKWDSKQKPSNQKSLL